MKKVIIMGAGGRDFFYHDRHFKNNAEYKVVAFTAAQIPGIANRLYPMRLAGDGRNTGIWIYPESELEYLINLHKKDGEEVEVYFAYSDVSWNFIKSKKEEVESWGAKFVFDLKRYEESMLKSSLPVVAVTAVRTGCGKSAATRYIARMLKDKGFKPIVVRHPMAYGDLLEKVNDVQRFFCHDDLNKYKCTFEEREEYEPIINSGFTVYAGVDYEKILRAAEQEGDVVIWDGGNNDLPFFKPNAWITVVDPHRFKFGTNDDIYPHGLCNLRNANIVLINKVKTARQKNIDINKIKQSILDNNPSVLIIETELKITISPEDRESIKGKRVVAIEDGPTVTHGGMSFGAAVLTAQENQCALADPYIYLKGSLVETFEKYPHLKQARLLPSVGYGKDDIQSLEDTINIMPQIKAVLAGTPIDLSRVLKLDHNVPIIPIKYKLDFVVGDENEHMHDDFGEARFRAELVTRIEHLNEFLIPKIDKVIKEEEMDYEDYS